MSYRATKSGLSAETQDKIKRKYEPELAEEVLKWIQSATGESYSCCGDTDNFQNVLKDGVILAKLANVLKPGSIKPSDIKPSTMSFKQMDLIQKAVNVFKAVGVMESELFQSVDLTESVNLHQVVICLQAVGRKCGHGPKESAENKRIFSEEQLKAGQNVIGLQMGTNKGASQAGMNMGKKRMITDDAKQ